MRVSIPVGLQLLELVSCAAVEEDCTSGLVIEVFDDLDKVSADVILQACLILEVCEDTVEVLLALEIFLTEDS